VISWFLSVAMAMPPSIDTPVRTGMRSPDDAAVVIGIEEYFLLPDAPFAERDAQAFRDFLRYSRGIPADRIQFLAGMANRELILDAVDSAADQVTGTLWIYFAGHGATSPVDRRRLLVGVDAQANTEVFETRTVALADLKQRTEGTQATEVIFVLDASFGGTARSGEELLPGTRFAIPTRISDAAGKTTTWIAATADQQPAVIQDATHGAFTYHLVGALRGWADGELGTADGQVTLDEADAWVERSLRPFGQTPVRVSALASDLVLVEGSLESMPTAEDTDSAEALPEGPAAVVVKSAAKAVQAVPGKPPANWTTQEIEGSDKRFVFTQDAVWDTETGLTWRREVAPPYKDVHTLVAWCKRDGADGGNWRLPNHDELRSLVHLGLDKDVFRRGKDVWLQTTTRTHISMDHGKGGGSQIGMALCVRGGEWTGGGYGTWVHDDMDLVEDLRRRERAEPRKSPKGLGGQKAIGSAGGFSYSADLAFHKKSGLTWFRHRTENRGSRDLREVGCPHIPTDGGGFVLATVSELREIAGNVPKEVFPHFTVSTDLLEAVDQGSGYASHALCVRHPSLTAPARPQSTDDDYEHLSAEVTKQVSSGTLWTRMAAEKLELAEAGPYCSGLKLGGISTWRLPTVAELESIVERGVGMPTVNELHFRIPETYSEYGVWTGDLRYGKPYIVDFGTAAPRTTDPTFTNAVLCVATP